VPNALYQLGVCPSAQSVDQYLALPPVIDGAHRSQRELPAVSRAGKTRRWLQDHRRDVFVKRAAQEGYRSRAAYKLAEIDDRDRIFAAGQMVVDLGAAPGGWSQLAAARTRPGGCVIAIDALAMDPLPGVEFIRGDFREREALERLEAALKGRAVDLVLSDMAPNMSGIRASDQARAMALAELALEFADRHLAPGGSLLVKVFQGADYPAFLDAMKRRCRETKVRKPEASKRRSAEHYLLGRSFAI
jgi:23S rRNA (uridine2552-2'-O)-methyltransferase